LARAIVPLILWITFAGVAMAAIALVGSVTLVMTEAALKRLLRRAHPARGPRRRLRDLLTGHCGTPATGRAVFFGWPPNGRSVRWIK
jgi:hypothetical protein